MKELHYLEGISKFVNDTMSAKDAKYVQDTITAFICANTPHKIGKINIWDWTADKKELRVALKDICFNDTDKEVCATDTHVLLVSKSLYTGPKGDEPILSIANSESKCRLQKRDGTYESNTTYPKYMSVIPQNTHPFEHLTREQCKDALLKVKAHKKISKARVYYIKFADNLYLSPDVLAKLVTLPGFEFTCAKNGYPIKYEDGDITAIAMPMYLDDRNQYEEIAENVYI